MKRIFPYFCLIGFVVSVVCVYTLNEHFTYYGDYSGYQTKSRLLAESFSQSPLSALDLLRHSFGAETSELFAVPILIFPLIFGESRLVYIVALALTYFVPYALAIGWICRLLVLEPQARVYWLGVGATVLTGPAWVPFLRGWPDIGGALCIALSIALYLRGAHSRDYRYSVAIGMFLGLAPLLRRQFGFASLSFVLALALHYVWVSHTANRNNWRAFVASLLRRAPSVMVVTLALLGTVISIGQDFVRNVLAINYHVLYGDYNVPPGRLLLGMGSYYGFLLLFIALVGYILATRVREINKESLAFLVILGPVTTLVWVFLGAQAAQHCTYQFTAIIVLGISLLVYASVRLLNTVGLRRFAVIGALLFASLDLAWTLAPP